MTTIRIAQRKRFTQVERTTVNDSRLSFKARGMLIWLLDKPDDWETNAEKMEQQGLEGREAIRSGLKELETFGYLVRNKYQDNYNKWRTEWTVYETPSSNPHTGTRYGSDPHTGSRRRKAVNGNPSVNKKTETDTKKEKSFPQGLSSKHSCECCDDGWILDIDGTATQCPAFS